MLVWPRGVATVFVYIIAFWAILAAIAGIAAGLRLRKTPGSGWVWFLAWGMLAGLFGIVLLVNPAAGILSMLWLVAIWAIHERHRVHRRQLLRPQGGQRDRQRPGLLTRSGTSSVDLRRFVASSRDVRRDSGVLVSESPTEGVRHDSCLSPAVYPVAHRAGADRVPERLHLRGRHPARRGFRRDGVAPACCRTPSIWSPRRAPPERPSCTPRSPSPAGYGEISSQPYGILAGVVESNSFVKGTWGAEIIDEMTPQPRATS